MCRLLSDWSSSSAAIELIRLNGIADEQIAESLAYLKKQTTLSDIGEIDGYDNWNAFFLMFCIKAANKP